MITLSAEGGVSFLYPSKHLAGVQRKMLDSNQRRFYPRRFSKPLLSAAQPIFRVGRRWNRTTIAKGRNRTVSDTVVPTIQGALPSGNNWTRTSGLSIISRMLYQLSYVSWPRKIELNYRHHVLQTCALPTELFPEVVPTGFEPVSTL